MSTAVSVPHGGGVQGTPEQAVIRTPEGPELQRTPHLAQERTDVLALERKALRESRLDRVDWRHGVVYFRVSYHAHVESETNYNALEARGSSIDRWVKENGIWLYDGRSPE